MPWRAHVDTVEESPGNASVHVRVAFTKGQRSFSKVYSFPSSATESDLRNAVLNDLADMDGGETLFSTLKPLEGTRIKRQGDPD